MQKVLTAAEMREVDRLTTEKYGIPSILLMENAGHAVARVITEKLGGSVKGKSILVLCGKGNNGGDGAALARILSMQGASCFVCLFGKVTETKGDARANFEMAREHEDLEVNFPGSKLGLRRFVFREIEDIKEFHNATANLREDVCVDALFGTGLTRRIEGVVEAVVSRMNHWIPTGRGSLIVSVDLPSGLDADAHYFFSDFVDDREIENDMSSSVRADVTVTLTAPKIANVMPPARHAGGELIVVGIGSPNSLVEDSPSQLFLAEKDDAGLWLRHTGFRDDSYKNKRGHCLIIAGSESYSGAAVLAGDSAMRSGVGLVTIATPRSSKDSIAARVLPEVMVRGVAETDGGGVAEEALEEIKDLLEKAEAVAVGSGLSQDKSTRKFVEQLIENRHTPVVIDADALNLLSPFRNPRSEGAPEDRTQSLILTPHEGEFLRLLGTDDKDVLKDRVAAVREFSQKHRVILVLKGERVLIGEPGGKVVVNPTGNSGLGKAGNGDTLTGILAGFVTQAVAMKIDIFETVVAAVYIAGMAGDIAEKKFGKRVMTASDVRECLVEVFTTLSEKQK